MSECAEQKLWAPLSLVGEIQPLNQRTNGRSNRISWGPAKPRVAAVLHASAAYNFRCNMQPANPLKSPQWILAAKDGMKEGISLCVPLPKSVKSSVRKSVHKSAISLDTYVGWEIVFIIGRRPKTALQQQCVKHKHSVACKSLTKKGECELCNLY